MVFVRHREKSQVLSSCRTVFNTLSKFLFTLAVDIVSSISVVLLTFFAGFDDKLAVAAVVSDVPLVVAVLAAAAAATAADDGGDGTCVCDISSDLAPTLLNRLNQNSQVVIDGAASPYVSVRIRWASAALFF